MTLSILCAEKSVPLASTTGLLEIWLMSTTVVGACGDEFGQFMSRRADKSGSGEPSETLALGTRLEP
jgi:hypothetical protein